MNRPAQTTGLIIVAATSSAAVIFLSLLVYEFHSETMFSLHQFTTTSNLCPGMEKQLLPLQPDSSPYNNIHNNISNTNTNSSSTQLRTHEEGNDSSVCDINNLVDTIVYSLQNSTLKSRNKSRLHLIPQTIQEVCGKQINESTQLVNKVIAKLGVKCRKKSRIIKVYHHPKTAKLNSNEDLETRHQVSSGISEFCGSFSNIQLNNQQYASNIYKKLESLLANSRLNKKYHLHVTVFTRIGGNDYGVSCANSSWVWKKEIKMHGGRTRVVVVLVTVGAPDVDSLDCLQQPATNIRISSVCVGSSDQCARTAAHKTEIMFSKCRRSIGQLDGEGLGALAVCWGCDVWHRWSPGSPVLHIQNSAVWNNLVWANTN